jgi:hypothetical protein
MLRWRLHGTFGLMGLLLLIGGCASAPSETRVPTQPVMTRPLTVLSLPLAPDVPQGPGQRYFDPNSTGVPVFDTKDVGDAPLSPYFVVSDFARTGATRFRYARIDAGLIQCLTRVREATNNSMTVLSAYRSFEYNERIRKAGEGAASNSYHISGKAADIVTATPVEQFAVAVYLECGCKVGLGISPRFYHVDIRSTPVTPWKYARSEASRLDAARRVQRNLCRP